FEVTGVPEGVEIALDREGVVIVVNVGEQAREDSLLGDAAVADHANGGNNLRCALLLLSPCRQDRKAENDQRQIWKHPSKTGGRAFVLLNSTDKAKNKHTLTARNQV